MSNGWTFAELAPLPISLDIHRAGFTTFALNALLLPLLDDDVPARWADPSRSMDCNDARVTVDGAHPGVGSYVPSAFTVPWRWIGARRWAKARSLLAILISGLCPPKMGTQQTFTPGV
jgi:hypothetical protein